MSTTSKEQRVLHVCSDTVKLEQAGNAIFAEEGIQQTMIFSIFPLIPWVNPSTNIPITPGWLTFDIERSRDLKIVSIDSRKKAEFTSTGEFVMFKDIETTETDERRLLIYLYRVCCVRANRKRAPSLERVGYCLADIPFVITRGKVVADFEIRRWTSSFASQQRPVHNQGELIATIRLMLQISEWGDNATVTSDMTTVLSRMTDRLNIKTLTASVPIIRERQIFNYQSMLVQKAFSEAAKGLVAVYAPGTPRLDLSALPLLYSSVHGLLPQVFFYEHAWRVRLPTPRWCAEFTIQCLQLALLGVGLDMSWFVDVCCKVVTIDNRVVVKNCAQTWDIVDTVVGHVIRVVPSLINTTADAIGENYCEPDLSPLGIPNAQLDCKKLAYFTILMYRIVAGCDEFQQLGPELRRLLIAMSVAVRTYRLCQVECTMHVPGDDHHAAESCLHVVNVMIPRAKLQWSTEDKQIIWAHRKDASNMLIDGMTNHQISPLFLNKQYESLLLQTAPVETSTCFPFYSWEFGRRMHTYGDVVVMYSMNIKNNGKGDPTSGIYLVTLNDKQQQQQVVPTHSIAPKKRKDEFQVPKLPSLSNLVLEEKSAKLASLFDVLESNPNVVMKRVCQPLEQLQQSLMWAKLQTETNAYSNLACLSGKMPFSAKDPFSVIARDLNLKAQMSVNSSADVFEAYHLAYFMSTFRDRDKANEQLNEELAADLTDAKSISSRHGKHNLSLHVLIRCQRIYECL